MIIHPSCYSIHPSLQRHSSKSFSSRRRHSHRRRKAAFSSQQSLRMEFPSSLSASSSSSSSSSRLKRKPDDLATEFLYGVSLSPVKKVRQDTGLPPIYEDTPAPIGLEEDMDAPPQPDIDLMEPPSELPSSASMNEERAIVLYKPVAPSLFPSAGPSIRINDSLLRTGMANPSSLLSSGPDSQYPWLQTASAGGTAVSGSAEGSDEQMMSDSVQGNSLAVIPWVPHILSMAIATQPGSGTGESQVVAHPAGIFDDDMPVDDLQVEGMTGHSQVSMDSGNLDDMSQGNLQGAVPTQSNHSFLSFGAEPWQRQNYGVPQPYYSSVMSSH